VLALWQILSVQSGSRMLPGLDAVAKRIGELAASGELWSHMSTTLARGSLGLTIALTLGFLLGILAARVHGVGAALNPIVSALYPVPKLALYPVVILLLGFGAGSKVTQVALECFFPIFVQCHAGARSMPRNMLWLAQNAGASRWQLLTQMILPLTLPYLLTGLRVAIPIMLIVMCVTEFIGESEGLGHLVSRYASYFDAAAAFGVVFVLGALGLLLDRIVVALRKRWVFWERGVGL
jgi:ABC-type nitrate/sulfonate/bicarbonate transport system permease component